jgi:4-hydroxy-tetrahydrodipicolinate reductase
MGRAVVRLAIEEKMTVACAIANADIGADAGELAGIHSIGVKIASDPKTIASVDAIIDFSSPAATAAIAAAAVSARAALVSGTTGLGDDAKSALAQAAKSIPVMWEPNMSVGIALLSRLVEIAASALPDADIEIVETHHRSKVDAPSGTALRLAEVAKKARAGSKLVTGREGKPGARSNEEIGVLAVRGGDVIGDHTVHLLVGGERIELTHRATTRDLFARGALRTARHLKGKPPGTYALASLTEF